MPNDLKILITPDAQAKIKSLVQECPTEMNGIGHISYVPGGILIDGIQVCKQEVSATSASHDTDDLMAFLMAQPDPGNWRLQFHSHVNMGVFWSGTDEEAIRSAGETADWMISIVFNKAGLYKSRMDIFKPLRITLETTLEQYVPVTDYSQWAKEELLEKIIRPVPAARVAGFLAPKAGEASWENRGEGTRPKGEAGKGGEDSKWSGLSYRVCAACGFNKYIREEAEICWNCERDGFGDEDVPGVDDPVDMAMRWQTVAKFYGATVIEIKKEMTAAAMNRTYIDDVLPLLSAEAAK